MGEYKKVGQLNGRDVFYESINYYVKINGRNFVIDYEN